MKGNEIAMGEESRVKHAVTSTANALKKEATGEKERRYGGHSLVSMVSKKCSLRDGEKELR